MDKTHNWETKYLMLIRNLAKVSSMHCRCRKHNKTENIKIWNFTTLKFGKAILSNPMKFQRTTLLNCFSIHDEHFKTHTGLATFKKTWYIIIHTRQLFFPQTCPSRCRHRTTTKQSTLASILFLIKHSVCFHGSSWSWSYDSWIYNFLCNQCLSPLMLWVRKGYNIMW